MESAVFVVIVLVVVVFAFVLGTISRPRDGSSEAGRLAAELEVERRRVGELQQEVDRLRELAR